MKMRQQQAEAAQAAIARAIPRCMDTLKAWLQWPPRELRHGRGDGDEEHFGAVVERHRDTSSRFDRKVFWPSVK
jgi:hypothetical protein